MYVNLVRIPYLFVRLWVCKGEGYVLFVDKDVVQSIRDFGFAGDGIRTAILLVVQLIDTNRLIPKF